MIYDLIIIGGGPAGLTASIYASRHKLSHLVFEAGVIGGQIATATEVENWPGDKSVTGMELAKRLEDHAVSLGMNLQKKIITELKQEKGVFVCSAGNEKFEAKSLILSTGAMSRKLGISGEDKFLGRGISYCATCDAPFFKDKPVAVIGGGDSALTEAVYLSDIASKVYIIHRRNEFRAQEANQDKVKNSKKIELVLSSTIKELNGDRLLKSILVENVTTKETKELQVEGVFVYVGNTPASALAKPLGVEIDEKSYIKTDLSMRTNVPGVFSAGDITGAAPQAIVASGQGAVAAMSAYKFIKGFAEGIAVVNR